MAVIVGTAGRDYIHRAGDFNDPPTGYNEIATATAGNDMIAAGGGDDIVHADAGDDTVRGGEGNDELAESAGDDLVFGEGGNDTLAAWGADTLNGGIGDDTFDLWFPEATDEPGLQMAGGTGTDTLRVGSASLIDISGVTLSGVERLEANNVILTAAQLMSFEVVGEVSWSFGSDLTLSTPATVDLTGIEIEGLVHLNGSTGDDTFTLSDDHFRPFDQLSVDGAGGDDTILGGEGTDGISGGEGGDSLVGGGGNDGISGNEGEDVLIGGNGHDVLIGDAGVDSLTGGAGNDIFYYGPNSEISGLAETVDGGSGTDELYLFGDGGGLVDLSNAVITGVEEITLGSRAVMTAAQLGSFSVVNGFGFERPDTITLSGPGTADLTEADISGVDAIRGSAGGDAVILTGVAEGQTIIGLGGNDTLTGGLGRDALDGRSGRDVIRGGVGADTLTGGASADTFAFGRAAESTPAGFDEITDFATGVDRIDLRAIDADTGTAANQAFAFIGSAAFGGTAGELRYSGGLLLGDVNGDTTADFQVRLAGRPSLAAGDLLL